MKSQSKSEFIRAQPPELSAVEVVKKAKASGIDLTAQLVYVVRSVSRRKKPGRPSNAALSRSTRVRGGTSDSSSEQFLALVSSIGLFRAEQLLAKFKADVASIHLGRY